MFRDRYTNQTLFVMLRDSPSEGAVDAFALHLSDLIRCPRPPDGTHLHEVAAFHARLVRQLLESGVLLPEEHAAIISRLQAQQSRVPGLTLVPNAP